jgi:hypothetical protein
VGPERVKSPVIYALLKRRWYPRGHKKKSEIVAEDIAMFEAQLIGWVLIALFFGAMVGGHKHTTGR